MRILRCFPQLLIEKLHHCYWDISYFNMRFGRAKDDLSCCVLIYTKLRVLIICKCTFVFVWLCFFVQLCVENEVGRGLKLDSE